ncbi:hypothetical protein [Nostoc sp.]
MHNSIVFGENQFQPKDMISVTFSVTSDLDAIFQMRSRQKLRC